MQWAHRSDAEIYPTLEQLEPRLLLDAIREPYLQAVTLDSVYVLLEANSQADAAVEYGLTDAYGQQAATESFAQTDADKWVHNVKLTDLLPNMVYHYRATQGDITSADYTFVTEAQPGTGFRFAWLADPRSNPPVFGEISALIDGHDPRFGLYGGDLCAGATWDSWDTEFFVPEQLALAAQVPFFNAAGNHEGWNALTQAFTQAPDAAGEAGGYYSLDYGDLHVLVLNTEVDYSEGSDQWNFALSDLSSSTARWKIVASHKPAYSSYREDANMQAMTSGIFEPNGVDMVLSGHDHYYEHNLVKGIHHMVIGSAGAPLYNPPGAAYTIYSEQTYNFAIFDLTTATCSMTAYREDATVIETIHLAKDSTPPTAPTGLSASPVSESQIDLAWTAADDPESGIHHYNVYRDTVLIDTATGTSYSDTGLSEATSYTYEVSAVNGAMAEGPRSGPVAEQTLADTTAPTLESVSATSASQVEVVFSEAVEQASAETVANYAIDKGVTVSSAALQGDTETVVLTVSALSQGVTYTLTVSNVTDRASIPNPIAAGAQQTFAYVVEQSLSFQQGMGAYAGARDTMVQGAYPDSNFAAATEMNADMDNGGAPSHPLLRLDDIIGAGLGQIAPGSTIVSATLRLYSVDDGNGGNVHRLLQPWDDTAVTWSNAFGGDGVQADGSEAAAVADDGVAQTFPSTDVDLDVTASVQAWANGEANHGWAILPNGTNGWRMSTAEHATPDVRPELMVTFFPGAPDETPPSTPTDLSATGVSESQIDLAWTAADDPESGIHHYNVYRDTVFVDTTAATSYSDTGLNEATSYTYEVSAVNGAMAEGPESTPAVGTTLADTTAPTLESVYAQSDMVVKAVFSEAVDATTAETVANYTITDPASQVVPIGGATLEADGVTVTLDLLAPLAMGATHTLAIANVEDLAGNPVAPGTQGDFVWTIDPNLIVAGSTWKYLDDGSNQPAAWREAAFDDGGWASGPAELGYGDGDEATVVSYGPDAGSKYITTYFRTTFTVGDTSRVAALALDLLRDDGAVVYINGAEVLRSNMPAIAIDFQTPAIAAVGGGDETTFFPFDIPTADLVNGDNLMAVEIHQSSGSSSDISFDLALTATIVSEPPVAADDAYGVDEDTPLSVDVAAGVLANDTDPENGPLTAILVDDAVHGELVLSDDGSFTYTPDANYFGTDGFTYVANDGGSDSNVAAVTITVASVNDAPVAADDAYEVEENGSLDIGAPAGVLVNDSDGEGDPLTAVLVGDVNHGVLALNADDGSFTYTPVPDFHGTDSFTYLANDGAADSDVATVTIKVTGTDVVAGNLRFESKKLLIDLTNTGDVAAAMERLQLDWPADNRKLAKIRVNDVVVYDTKTDPPTALIDQWEDGSLPARTIGPGGAVTLTLEFERNASTNESDYILSIDFGEGLIVFLPMQPNPPIAADDAYAVDEDGLLSTNAANGVLANDIDPDGDPLSAALVGSVSHGSLVLNGDGSFDYAPGPDFFGTDSFTYKANDGTLDSNEATVTIAINPVNDPPVAVANAYGVDEDQVLNIPAPGVLGNDSDPEGAALTSVLGTAPSQGELTLNPDGSFTYVPAADFNGSDSFTYVANDGTLDSAEAVVAIAVNAVNDPPVASDDSAVTGRDTPAVIDVLANDSDVDGDALEVIDLGDPDYGSVVDNGDGTVTYTPQPAYVGDDSFTYTVGDGKGGTDTAAVNVTVTQPNDPPVAQDDSAATNEDTPVVIDVLANDSDANGDALTVVSAGGAANGVVTNNGTDVTYAPDADFNGIDAFTYTVSDGKGGQDTAAVTVSVTAVNDPPVAADEAYTVDQDQTLAVNVPGVLGNDSDVDGDPLTALLVGDVSHGTLTLNADGSFTYTPAPEFHGMDNFTYEANDAVAASTAATVTITVNQTGVVGSNLVFEGKTFSIDLTNNAAAAVTIDRIQLGWPANIRKLRKIKVNGATVYDTKTNPPTALIDLWKDGSLADRTIGPGETITLTFEFERDVSTDIGEYGLSIDFGQGLQVFI